MPLCSMFRDSKQRFIVAGHEAGIRNGINGSGLRTDRAFFDFPRSEIIFEERFRIAPWLNRMGADVTTDGREAVIEGKAHLSGQMVKAQELRGGAALVIATLMAQGITRVYGSAFIERGYEDLAGDLRKLGAVISKKKAER